MFWLIGSSFTYSWQPPQKNAIIPTTQTIGTLCECAKPTISEKAREYFLQKWLLA
jgi:hypothetical protein